MTCNIVILSPSHRGRNWLVAIVRFMRRAIREECVCDEADDRKDEDQDTPEHFIRDRARRADNFHYTEKLS